MSNALANALGNVNFGNPSGGSEGNGETEGNAGSPDGEVGDVNGRGSDWGLKGRGFIKRPKPLTGFQEEGIVYVKIKVNRAGQVVSAKVDFDRSTTSSPQLHALAMKSAKTAQFNASSRASVEQWGFIKFNFQLH